MPFGSQLPDANQFAVRIALPAPTTPGMRVRVGGCSAGASMLPDRRGPASPRTYACARIDLLVLVGVNRNGLVTLHESIARIPLTRSSQGI